jgi:hypothetical protein
VVAVFSRPGTTASESGLHLALAASTRHAFAALLAGKASHRIPAPDVSGVNNGGDDYQDDDEHAWQSDCSKDTVEHAPDNLHPGGRSG